MSFKTRFEGKERRTVMEIERERIQDGAAEKLLLDKAQVRFKTSFEGKQ